MGVHDGFFAQIRLRSDWHDASNSYTKKYLGLESTMFNIWRMLESAFFALVDFFLDA
jgi:hypothetical protein